MKVMSHEWQGQDIVIRQVGCEATYLTMTAQISAMHSLLFLEGEFFKEFLGMVRSE